MKMFPLTNVFSFLISPYIFFVLSAPLQTRGEVRVFCFVFSTASLGYYFYNQEQLPKSQLGPQNASEALSASENKYDS